MLSAALEQPAPARSDFLDAACAGDDDLRREVERLLEADAAPDWLPSPRPCVLEGETPDGDSPVGNQVGVPPMTMTGRRIGAFTLVRLIGIGGMGAVYEAQQDRPSRTVALKLLRWGPASPQAVKRFRFEAEVLGRLQHPGIAQVFEFGMQRIDGLDLPYCAMEYVPGGRTLREYATTLGLGIPERIRLFVQVCEAVQHGHLRGVIHRDLKPANLLVLETESGPRVKVIDFGVARLVGPEAKAQTLTGEDNALVGTIEYMSPEQLGAQAEEIDARTDVYSLGVVLFELLTGELPRRTGESEGVLAGRTSTARLPAHAGQLVPALKGDPEIILSKALEPDRTRRYQSAQLLGDDLVRFLQGEAILARAPSTAYRVRMLVRRHKPLAISLAALALVLIAGVVSSLTLAGRALRARDAALASEMEAKRQTGLAEEQARRARRVADFLISTLDSVGGPSADYARDAAGWDERFYPLTARSMRTHRLAGQRATGTTLIDVLTCAAARVDEELVDDPLVRAEVLHALAVSVKGADGPIPLSRELRQKAIDLRMQVLGPSHPDTIQDLFELGVSHAGFGDWRSAERFYLQALEGCGSTQGPPGPMEGEIHRSWIGVLLTDPTQVDRAVALQRTMYERCIAHLGVEDPSTSLEETLLGWGLALKGESDEALQHSRHAHQALVHALGKDHVATSEAGVTLADVLQQQSPQAHAGECRELINEHIRVLKLVFGPHTSHVHWHQRQLQDLLVLQGDYADNEALVRDMLESDERTLHDENYQRLGTKARLARAIVWSNGDLEEAEQLARAAVTQLGPKSLEVRAFLRCTLADVLRARRVFFQADSLISETMDEMWAGSRAEGPDRVRLPEWLWAYAYGVRAHIHADLDCHEDATLAYDQAWVWNRSWLYGRLAISIVLMRSAIAYFDAHGDELRAQQWRRELESISPGASTVP